MTHVPENHPRYLSLKYREIIAEGVRRGITAIEGMTAHGRGETFDYILGEKTHDFAFEAERAAVALMLLSRHPVISVNGNTAALVPKEIIELSEVLSAVLEVNIFHFSEERVRNIKEYIESFGGKILADLDAELKGLTSARRMVSSKGILIADTVMVPLEDGDRCEILKTNGKKTITIDLNPLSRTSRMADITIVDNIIRAIPNMIKIAEELKDYPKKELEEILARYDNKKILNRSIIAIRDYLTEKATEVMS
ncbi:pantothenate synthetase [Archaeoglobus sulfaticallidus PM70-1]|uniref:4-phosphopantoate--beta-alanine ligase n=1 Tax=Archaeoglobus sulfaticallidus PM70-1 TaxID=387631 RepID=N0BD84_9EURY|nr:4-phosphopantoate--beta-alanine ligase [Archaeoglobus sulfaticallidus]AGK61569.1 pantothenate synthetase [Archaeoglobus sulfaticallidus PM70-1]